MSDEESEQLVDLANELMQLGRDWRAGKCSNIGPAITRIHLNMMDLALGPEEGFDLT